MRDCALMEPGCVEDNFPGTSALVQAECSHIPAVTAPLEASFWLILCDPEQVPCADEGGPELSSPSCTAGFC